MKDNIKRLQELKNLLDKYNYHYYQLNESLVSDFEFDMLLKELIEIESRYPELKTSDSPSNRVGGVVASEFKKRAHTTPMLSLANAFSLEDLLAFDSNIKKATNLKQIKYVAELKIDGLSLNVKYKDGMIEYATTRGNGEIGEEVTDNAKTIRSIPLKISTNQDVEVRGEVYLKKSVLASLNKERQLNNAPLFTNTRNTASGTLRQLDSRLVAKRKLDMFCYHLVSPNTFNINSQSDTLKFLKDLGFKINESYYLSNSINDIYNHIKIIEKKRDSYDYEIDGVVIKVDDFNLYDSIGFTAKSPKYAIAYKFEAEQKESVIRDITLSVGRTGKITPTAIFDKIFLAGSNVSKATLNNQDFIKELGVNIGSKIVVRKAGDIIPEIIRVLNRDDTYYEIPKTCPSCSSILYKSEDDSNYYCRNFQCTEKNINSLIYFVSREAMNIEGLGESNIEALFNANIITDIVSLYNLKEKREQLVMLDGFNIKSVDNIIKEVEKSKGNSLEFLIIGLGILGLGEKLAKSLVRLYPTIDLLMSLREDDILKISDFGKTLAHNITTFFKDPININMINQLKDLGLNMNYLGKQIITNHFFSSKIVVITGTLENFERKELTTVLESLGAKVTSSVSKNTNYVIYGESAGSKLSDAKRLNIKTLNERELLALLNNKE